MNNIDVIQLGADDPTLTRQNVKQYSQDGIVEYGEKDYQFQYLLDLYVNSTTHNAIANAVSLLVYGQGLNADGVMEADELRNIVRDFEIFGNYTIQVVNGKLLHVPVNYIRAEEVDENGVINNYYYSTDWTDSTIEPIVIPNWEVQPNAKRSIFYGKRYTPNAFYYGLPKFQGALSYMEQEIEVAKFLNNYVKNSFSVNKIINFNNGVPQDEKQRKQQVRDIKRKLTGADGDKIIVAFNETGDNAATIENIVVDNASEQYAYMAEEAQNKIIVGWGVTSPLLVGIRTSNGFSSNSDEMLSAAVLFENMQIKPDQNFIADGLNKLTGRTDLAFVSTNPLAVPETPETETEDAVREDTELSEVNQDLQEFLDLGQDALEGYTLFDEAEVDYDIEDELDAILEDELGKNETMLSKAVNLVSTGQANPRTKSEQDTAEFVVRYRYRGEGKGDREFCTAMSSANKLYRKEDITRLRNKPVNPGFGEGGKNTYDIWLYKGGPRCHHAWFREIYLKEEVSDKSRVRIGDRISVARARRLGTVEPNNPKVAKHPNDMARKGFSPKNKNLPKDAK